MIKQSIIDKIEKDLPEMCFETNRVIPYDYCYEDENHHYWIQILMRKEEKHYCKDCIYCIDNECVYHNDKYIFQSGLHYCRRFDDEERCWDCVNYTSYPGECGWCEKGYQYEDNYNDNNECPEFELDY